ncbi:MAG: amidohydrolase [Faecousia sp.]
MSTTKNHIYAEVDRISGITMETCKFLWENPETGGNEKVSADYMRNLLRGEGFAIINEEKLEHAFCAEYGAGHPVIAILGEYDALPGLSQKNDSAEKCPVVPGGPGHGCGHNLIGSASVTGAIALKNIMEKENLPGTIRFYGCPEEELLSGKVKMAYYHMFDGCDIAISWHPGSSNIVLDKAYLACAYAKYYFTGTTAHAAFAPHLGRSALDAMELMNVGVNYLREHVIESARIHYATDSCGCPPNIVPDKAVNWYCVRAPKISDVKSILDRIEKVARGAAMMTETSVDVKVEYGCCDMRPSPTYADLTQAVMEDVPMPVYTAEELALGARLQETSNPDGVRAEKETYGEDSVMHTRVASRELGRQIYVKASSDSGDVSYMMPMNLINCACWPFGVAPHTWQATACAGNSIGAKGTVYAAKVMAAVGYELLTNPEATNAIIQEFKDANVNYSPMYND